MALDLNQLEKPFNTLGKLLKKLPKKPSPEQVHDIRTRTRRVEAALHALTLDRKRMGERVTGAVTPIRKRAGKVRDMDVLIEFASVLSPGRDGECRVQLLEHLGHKRVQGARKLHKVVARRRGVATESLKRCESSIARNFKNGKGGNSWSADAAATALELSGELANWPKLSATNLHPFRLKVKELRNVLQLSGKKDTLVDSLGEVKDKIGEWHDWTELAEIAQDVLRHSNRCEVMKQIRWRAKQQFQAALASANQLREKYFSQSRAKNKRRMRSPPVTDAVLEATARLAA
jgi:CHAD domain-containing protein